MSDVPKFSDLVNDIISSTPKEEILRSLKARGFPVDRYMLEQGKATEGKA